MELLDPAPLTERATGWLHGLGLSEGERVLTLLPNGAPALGLGLAAMQAGIVQVPLPAALGTAEVRQIADDARPSAAVVDRSVAHAAEALDVPVYHLDDEVLAGATPRQPGAGWPRTRPMAYTSGTTGRRKGVHVGIHDQDWGRRVVVDEHDAFDRRHGHRHLVVSPLYHSGPFRFAFVSAYTGGRVAVLPRFDARDWLTAIRTLRPTSMFCVPTHLHRLLSLPDLSPDDLSSVRLLAHAGAPCPEPLKARVLEVFPPGAVWEFYGSTEGQFTVCPPATWREAPGTVGHARAGRRLEVRGEDGRPVADGDVGTVWVSAPPHARWRYWDDPERTALAWDGDAFSVGDLGHLVDGRLFLDGRPGDLVITGGVNVYPAEVERQLLAQPGVAEAVVFGVPDGEWGERVVAAVVPHEGARLDGEGLRRALREILAAPKVPKRIDVVADLPRTDTGKVRRVGLPDALGANG